MKINYLHACMTLECTDQLRTNTPKKGVDEKKKIDPSSEAKSEGKMFEIYSFLTISSTPRRQDENRSY